MPGFCWVYPRGLGTSGISSTASVCMMCIFGSVCNWGLQSAYPLLM
uniref:Uncharacterized protein n=1 Tax=Anguilla anguilla TaxID=7936 RepID=A0A0E9S300_ANGAN